MNPPMTDVGHVGCSVWMLEGIDTTMTRGIRIYINKQNLPVSVSGVIAE